MEIRILSDLHFEFLANDDKAIKKSEEIIPRERKEGEGGEMKGGEDGKERGQEILILAGDICVWSPKNNRLFLILETLKKNWKHILYTPGNHEYYKCLEYGLTPQQVDLEIEKICEKIGVYFLQKKIIEIEGIKFGGCTLWSELDSYAASTLNDIGKIFKGRKEYNSLHHSHLKFLMKEKIDVVITHHLPSYQCIHPRFKNDPCNSAFASELESKLFKGKKLWIYGHSHENTDFMIDETRFVGNPIGYPGERRETKPNIDFSLIL